MSDQPVPSSPQPPEAKGSLSQVIEKVGPIARKVWVTSRPTLSQALKATIGLLQQATQKIDTQIANDPSEVPPLNLEPLQKASATFWGKTQPLWVKLIAGVRGKLPADISLKLSDRALSGVVAGMSLLLLTLTTHLPSGSAAPRPVPARPKVVATPPSYQRPAAAPVAPTAAPPQSFPSALSAPGVTASPAPNITAANPATAPRPATVPAPVAVAPTTTAPMAAPIATLPAAPIATTPRPNPASAQPVAAAPITPKPAPVKKLTPQEKLLASLQETLGDQGQLVATVKPNKAAGQLQVNLKSDWYQLDLAQQDQLAQTLFTKAQTLKFRSLELLDAKDEVLARSPVVGNEMVVLVRQAMDSM